MEIEKSVVPQRATVERKRAGRCAEIGVGCHGEDASVDRRAAGVGVVAGGGEGACAGLRQRTCSAGGVLDYATEGGVVGGAAANRQGCASSWIGDADRSGRTEVRLEYVGCQRPAIYRDATA